MKVIHATKTRKITITLDGRGAVIDHAATLLLTPEIALQLVDALTDAAEHTEDEPRGKSKPGLIPRVEWVGGKVRLKSDVRPYRLEPEQLDRLQATIYEAVEDNWAAARLENWLTQEA